MNNWQAIRDFYRMNSYNILSCDKQKYGVDPYWWEGVIEMTPIEKSVWYDIRNSGVVFYPQYPVLNFFIDFGNPLMKIAIECDGKQWNDEKKDKTRDDRLASLGWTVYRFKGSDCLKSGYEVEDDDGVIAYQMSDVELLLKKIKHQ